MLNILVEDVENVDMFVCANGLRLRGQTTLGWHLGNQMYWAKKIRRHWYCNYIKISDYTPEQGPAILLISVPGIEGFFDDAWIHTMPQATVDLVRQYNIPIMLTQPDEYFVSYSQEQIERFDRSLCERGLTSNLVMTHSINKCYGANREIHIGQRKIINIFAFGWLSTTKINPVKIRRSEYKRRSWVCINRTMRELRSLFYLNAISNNIDKSGYISFMAEYGGKPVVDFDLPRMFTVACEYVSEPVRTHLRAAIPEAVASLPRYLDANKKANGLTNPDLESYRAQAWFEVVTETHDIKHDVEDIAILSEKALFPIAHGIPFIAVGHKKLYQLLTELGFEMYDSFEYNAEGTIEQRLASINAWMLKFNAMTQSQRKMWFQSQRDKIKHNKDLLFKTDWDTLEELEITSAISGA